MVKVRKAKVVKTRQVNTYYEMWRVSYWTMHQAQEEFKGSYFQIMASLRLKVCVLHVELRCSE